jgi:predicted RND superfamily exporter protein
MVEILLKGISYLCLHHHRKILLILFIVFGIAFALTGRIRFDPNFLKLFPAERGSIKLYMENLQEAGTFDHLFILLEEKERIDSQRLIGPLFSSNPLKAQGAEMP